MRKVIILTLAASAVTLSGCGLGKRKSLDEFAVARNAPLVIPPDAGTVTLSPEGAQSQAIEALFGGPAPRSAIESSMLDSAGRDRAALGARSIAGDNETRIVDKGATTQAIIAAPQGDGQDASAQTPQ